FLIGERPENDAGMIAVAADEPGQAVERLRRAAGGAIFVQHKKAEAVAGIEQLRRGGTMRGTVGVGPDFAQALEPEVLQRIGQRHADAGVILMAANALDFDVPAIEKKAALRIETNAAEAERRLHRIGYVVAAAQRRDQAVKCRRFRRPKARSGDG